MGTTVKLDAFLEAESGPIFVTGPQSWWLGTRVVRWADQAANLNTTVELSGYPGSPFAGVTTIGHEHSVKLAQQRIFHNPSLNEISAVNTAIGNQRVTRYGGELDDVTIDGVASFVVFKGPGLDQSWDSIKGGAIEGTDKHGGVVIGVGDDTQGSSTALWFDSKKELQANGILVLSPSSVEEIPEYLLFANRLSRHSGCFVAINLTSEIAESSGIADIDRLKTLQVTIPEKLPATPRGMTLNYDPKLTRHDRGALVPFRERASTDFIDANFFNHVPAGWEGGKKPTLGIAAPGVSYSHVRAALRELGIDEKRATELGIRLLKLGAPSLISEDTADRFAAGLDKILVVEELHDGTESNLRNVLYDLPGHPRVLGRLDENGQPLLPASAHDVYKVAQAIAKLVDDPDVKTRAAKLDRRVKDASIPPLTMRPPVFCSGCPHSQGTKGIFGGLSHDDSVTITVGGNGCFTLASEGFSSDLERAGPYSNMGGEDTVIGLLRYLNGRHVTQLIGDGTAFHSSFKALDAVSAFARQHPGIPVNTTFKVLNNGTTAMTGGQPLPNQITAGMSLHEKRELSSVVLAQRIAALGITNISIVSDGDWMHRMTLRWELIKVLPRGTHIKVVSDTKLSEEGLRLKEEGGVNALIHESECATEKRRRRVRGKDAPPDTRVIVNQEVCDACGDCDITSGGCTAVQSKPTALGRKTTVNQTICNVDYACTKGFCPSFSLVTGKLKRNNPADLLKAKNFTPNKDIPLPSSRINNGSHSILTPGIGGLGATTVGRIIGQAVDVHNKAYPDARPLGYIGYDATGLAQKGGPVVAHSTILDGRSASEFTSRISTADVVLACDAVVASDPQNLARIDFHKTVLVVNSHVEPVFKDKYVAPGPERDAALIEHMRGMVSRENFHTFNASAVSVALTGTALAANTVLMGYAFQKGLIPLSLDAITDSIKLNGTSVNSNLAAFEWGRRCAEQPEIARIIEAAVYPKEELPKSLQAKINLYTQRLTEFQDAAYAATYHDMIERVRALDIQLGNTTEETQKLTARVADSLFKVMYWKDEFEVSRHYTSASWKAELDRTFEPGYKVTHMLSPPILGLKTKIPLPAALMKPAFRVLAGMKGKRETWADPFRWTAERRIDRERLSNYVTLLEDMLTGDNGSAKVKPQNYGLAVGLAGLPMKTAGYGHVKAKAHAKHPIPVEFAPVKAQPRGLAA